MTSTSFFGPHFESEVDHPGGSRSYRSSRASSFPPSSPPSSSLSSSSLSSSEGKLSVGYFSFSDCQSDDKRVIARSFSSAPHLFYSKLRVADVNMRWRHEVKLGFNVDEALRLLQPHSITSDVVSARISIYRASSSHSLHQRAPVAQYNTTVLVLSGVITVPIVSGAAQCFPMRRSGSKCRRPRPGRYYWMIEFVDDNQNSIVTSIHVPFHTLSWPAVAGPSSASRQLKTFRSFQQGEITAVPFDFKAEVMTGDLYIQHCSAPLKYQSHQLEGNNVVVESEIQMSVEVVCSKDHQKIPCPENVKPIMSSISFNHSSNLDYYDQNNFDIAQGSISLINSVDKKPLTAGEYRFMFRLPSGREVLYPITRSFKIFN